jgi:hypothetical protein
VTLILALKVNGGVTSGLFCMLLPLDLTLPSTGFSSTPDPVRNNNITIRQARFVNPDQKNADCSCRGWVETPFGQ